MPAGTCDFCGVEEYMPYACKFCKGRFCAAHRLPENHGCAGLGAYKDKVREQGRVFQSDPLVRPVVAKPARARASLDSLWAKLDGKVSYVIIGVCLAVFLVQVILQAAGQGALETDLFVITNGFVTHPWTIVTSLFAHENLYPHLFFNMLAIAFMGPAVERLIGSRRFALLFLLSGAVAAVAQILIEEALHPGEAVGALGASGAIQGFMGTLVVLAPTLTILVFFVIPAPLWAFIAFFVLLDLVGVISPGDSVAHFAHLAGLAVGVAYGFYLRQRGLRAVVRPREPTIRRYF
ncbi:MAG: hypothetical protein QOE90_3612 [Thermoplasmata archaeon]|jgi:membrane associated rhomboid family serine protease|nr:hypothetical protein [Thermoplasmata archaeon]